MSEIEDRGQNGGGEAESESALKVEHVQEHQDQEQKQDLYQNGAMAMTSTPTSSATVLGDFKPDLNSLFSPTSPKRVPSETKEDEGEDGNVKEEQPIASSSSNSASASVIGEEDLNTRTHTHNLTRDSTPSSSATAGAKRGRKSVKATPTPAPAGPQLIDELPEAWDEAHETFEALEKCHYEVKSLGLSKEQDEMMVCDCVWDRTRQTLTNAFFPCRFSKRQYADVQVVLTEKKGFGLRAGSYIPANTLIYEYIGEVVAERTFRKRMQQYADEGIKHFYFMMLQKEEYIDATKKGGIGRFANHSCNPNSEVQKWVVGRRLRMGIFTKRDVVKGEEITFNYNVDRYGHDAQTCYCGEPNCVGTIGGKTQTDVGTMNDLFLDALGISDEVEAQGMKGNKKKKSRQLDEDFVPVLRPIVEPEVQKVSAAIRQSMENKTMMSRLLQRIKMTEEPMIQRQLMRMHGFSLMSMILTELADDREIILLALESMSKWKLQIRNKIEDSNVEQPVKELQDSPDSEISNLAKQLLEYWSTLELSYKIPRVSKIASLDAEDEADTTTIAEANTGPSTPAAARRHDAWENNVQVQFDVAPVRPRIPVPSFHRPRPPPPPPAPAQRPAMSAAASSDRLKLEAIIAMAQQPLPAPILPALAQSPAAESSRSGSRYDEEEDRRKRQKRSHGYGSSEVLDEAKKEKRLTILVGQVVVRSMNKYKEQMEHDTFKRYARECTTILVEKEKKGHTYPTTRVPTLSEEKKAKMKAFTKDFTHKVLKRLKEKGKLIRVGANREMPSQSARSNSNPTSTPSRLGRELDTSESQSLATPTPSGTVIETPRDQDDKEGDLVDDIFGKDDDDMDMELEMDMEVDDDLGQTSISASAKSLSTQTQSNGISHNQISPHSRDIGSSPLSRPVQAPVPLEEIKSAPVTVKKMNGGYTVESLDLSLLSKVNGNGGGGKPQAPPAHVGQVQERIAITQEGVPSDGVDTPRTRTSTYSENNLSPEQ
ncbi:histone-lysine N-methyltransferase, H3 lysine-36 specific [Kwoniella heveanensis CBS 569]|nr:histone-lysine N-methyltransferase, H3 lysine-36 specific [Kwoniella heveanensis CBS 569]